MEILADFTVNAVTNYFKQKRTKEELQEKCEKNYQSDDKMFYFVPISHNKQATDYVIPPVPFKENIKVLPIRNFINFFKFNNEHRDLLNNFVNKALEVKRTRDIEELKKLAEISQNLDSIEKGQRLLTDFF
ncbi:MAG: hypothetical protein HWN65_16695 [Candidatus Helarchaeota archaeon]|nr:hypothetical protein [Candidatus Helarchaeota archaeon]